MLDLWAESLFDKPSLLRQLFFFTLQSNNPLRQNAAQWCHQISDIHLKMLLFSGYLLN